MIEIVINFIRVSDGKGYKLEKMREIMAVYVKGRFKFDIVCLVALIIDITFDFELAVLLRLVFVLKLPDYLEKIEALETKFVNTSYR